MMTTPKPIFMIILAGLALSAAACACPFQLPFSPNPKPENSAWQTEVDTIREMTRGLAFPNALINLDDPIPDDLFDPNQLLDPLDHLALEEGYSLDFIYLDDGMGGYPILYARPENQAPYETVAEYEAATTNCGQDNTSLACDYLSFVHTDGTEEGYFQWVLLRMMGDQFYLFWHANYHDAEIIASQERLGTIVDEYKETDFGYPFSESEIQDILKIDPVPQVTINEDHVVVRVVWFTKWGGFFESRYTLNKDAPHTIIEVERENLVPYDCGVMF